MDQAASQTIIIYTRRTSLIPIVTANNRRSPSLVNGASPTSSSCPLPALPQQQHHRVDGRRRCCCFCLGIVPGSSWRRRRRRGLSPLPSPLLLRLLLPVTETQGAGAVCSDVLVERWVRSLTRIRTLDKSISHACKTYHCTLFRLLLAPRLRSAGRPRPSSCAAQGSAVAAGWGGGNKRRRQAPPSAAAVRPTAPADVGAPRRPPLWPPPCLALWLIGGCVVHCKWVSGRI